MHVTLWPCHGPPETSPNSTRHPAAREADTTCYRMTRKYSPTHHTPVSRSSRLHPSHHLQLSINHQPSGHTRYSFHDAVLCGMAVNSWLLPRFPEGEHGAGRALCREAAPSSSRMDSNSQHSNVRHEREGATAQPNFEPVPTLPFFRVLNLGVWTTIFECAMTMAFAY